MRRYGWRRYRLESGSIRAVRRWSNHCWSDACRFTSRDSSYIEFCATIARRTHDRALAMADGEATLAAPYLTLHPLDHALAAEAADVAATCALRGTDAMYVATARHAGASLHTLDAEVRDRAGALVTVLTPDEWSREMT